MTKQQAKELLPIIQAWVEGKEIQWKDPSNQVWITVLDNELHLGLYPNHYEWRIKPQPREFWINKYLNDSDYYVHLSKESADEGARLMSMKKEIISIGREVIHVREVI